jgi:hypothetical protein
VEATGLSADPNEYRARLAHHSDDELDTWAAELMRDVAIRRGVIRVVEAFRAATGLTEDQIERAFAFGGGAPAIAGRNAAGQLMIPAVALHHIVPGYRALVPDGRDGLVAYLVANFHEIVFV